MAGRNSQGFIFRRWCFANDEPLGMQQSKGGNRMLLDNSRRVILSTTSTESLLVGDDGTGIDVTISFVVQRTNSYIDQVECISLHNSISSSSYQTLIVNRCACSLTHSNSSLHTGIHNGSHTQTPPSHLVYIVHWRLRAPSPRFVHLKRQFLVG